MNKYNKWIFILATILTFTSTTFSSDIVDINSNTDTTFKLSYKPISEDAHIRLTLVQRNMGLRANVNSLLPAKVDYRDYCEIMDQGSLGSCTANSLVQGRFSRQAMAIQETQPGLSITDAKKKAMMGSRLWLYYEERALEGTIHEDEGASLYSGMSVMHTQGLAQEKDWPYIQTNYKIKPAEIAYKNALPYVDIADLSSRYINVRSNDAVDQMKQALSQKFMLSIGIMLYSSFQSATVQRTGNVPVPDTSKEQFGGGHAVLVVGYEEDQKHFILANSWGKNWGKNGFFMLPYEYFNPSRHLVSEVWKVGAVNPIVKN